MPLLFRRHRYSGEARSMVGRKKKNKTKNTKNDGRREVAPYKGVYPHKVQGKKAECYMHVGVREEMVKEF